MCLSGPAGLIVLVLYVSKFSVFLMGGHSMGHEMPVLYHEFRSE
jgi:hypothetical protein